MKSKRTSSNVWPEANPIYVNADDVQNGSDDDNANCFNCDLAEGIAHR